MNTAVKRGRLALALSAVLSVGLLAVELTPAAAKSNKSKHYRRGQSSSSYRYSPSRYRSSSSYGHRHSSSCGHEDSSYRDSGRYRDSGSYRDSGRYRDSGSYRDYDNHDEDYGYRGRSSRSRYSDPRANYDPRERFEPHGDWDVDGIPNCDDPDRDGDGVPNRRDRFEFNTDRH